MLTPSLEYTRFAFTTQKGTYTLVGTDYNHRTKTTIDTFRHLGTNNFYEWNRKTIHDWWKNGKISPVEKATSIVWYQD